ncbi:Argininosuccinate lyase [Kordia antarctica]|uniref:Argininosuccinate lyase n=1 Tax=Kordia antarctica TaxID=1218801 RepID=A0A7L4ZG23_9FLAO|nr:argininosuccinate lyase [Kordia antarctica]QHI35439.1 Argininosuccinate lyase [Kordia antarctica]
MKNNFKEAILLIESNTSGTGVIFANLAHQENLKVILITQGITNYNFDSHVEKQISESFEFDELFKVISELGKKYTLVGITSTSDYYIELAGKLAQKYNLPHPNVNTIQQCRNKFDFRSLLLAEGMQCPQFKLIKDKESLHNENFDKNFNYPVIVKPVTGSGSIGVKLITNHAALVSHGEELLKKTVNERKQKVDNSFLVEEFIEGDEFSLEVFDGEIIGVTKKYKSQLPYFVEIGHDFPFIGNDAFMELVAKMLDQLKDIVDLNWGAFHIEFIQKIDELFIVEVNPRLAGGFIPLLIQEAYGIDLLKRLFLKVTAKPNTEKKNKDASACIRFIIPEKSGKIGCDFTTLNTQNWKSFLEFKMYNKTLNPFVKSFDFRDRIGHVITVDSALDKAKEEVNELLNNILDRIKFLDMDNTGRIEKGIDPRIKKIIFGNKIQKKDLKELFLISKIDKAHILMLKEVGLMSQEKASKILFEIAYFEKINFEPLIGTHAPRGLYMCYENWLIEQLGMDVAGSIHLGRSRNDMNATMAMLQTRKDIIEVVAKLLEFVEMLCSISKEYKDFVMPAYTHFQPAVPITYGYYLQAIAIALKKHTEQFLSIEETLKVSPMGSCSVGGTSVPIDTDFIAKLLGFDKGPMNAMESVASRDFILDFLSKISISSVLVSRIATDFILWNTQEFSLFELSDQITGASSIMPNKRNPFILENIQGKLGVVSASFSGAITAMHKTPFTNSISVGTESKLFLNQSKQEFIDAIELLKIFIENAKPKKGSMKKRALESHTIATEYANKLVLEYGFPFREAHFLVGKSISNMTKISKLNESESLNKYNLSDSIEDIVENSKYGGGPSSINTENNFEELKKNIEMLERKINKYTSKWEAANNQLNVLCNKTIYKSACKTL